MGTRVINPCLGGRRLAKAPEGSAGGRGAGGAVGRGAGGHQGGADEGGHGEHIREGTCGGGGDVRDGMVGERISLPLGR